MNGERETENGKRRTGNGERRTGAVPLSEGVPEGRGRTIRREPINVLACGHANTIKVDKND
jgi:hypothetical protein